MPMIGPVSDRNQECEPGRSNCLHSPRWEQGDSRRWSKRWSLSPEPSSFMVRPERKLSSLIWTLVSYLQFKWFGDNFSIFGILGPCYITLIRSRALSSEGSDFSKTYPGGPGSSSSVASDCWWPWLHSWLRTETSDERSLTASTIGQRSGSLLKPKIGDGLDYCREKKLNCKLWPCHLRSSSKSQSQQKRARGPLFEIAGFDFVFWFYPIWFRFRHNPLFFPQIGLL